MSWFNNSDVSVSSRPQQLTVERTAESIEFDSQADFVSAPELEIVKNKIGVLQPGKSVWFKTDGAWSNYHLLEYILQITGPAMVYFTTWAISEIAITKFLNWKSSGQIIDVYAVIDAGLRNRKPQVFQQANNAFQNLKIAHCHAKATVVESGTHHITFIGSANYTRNPRKEVGVILWDKTIADANKNWIINEINGTDSGAAGRD